MNNHQIKDQIMETLAQAILKLDWRQMTAFSTHLHQANLKATSPIQGQNLMAQSLIEWAEDQEAQTKADAEAKTETEANDRKPYAQPPLSLKEQFAAARPQPPLCVRKPQIFER
jgi:flagellar biosynthesis/type III secretory pathway chaperone